jgi:hypothetical protein
VIHFYSPGCTCNFCAGLRSAFQDDCGCTSCQTVRGMDKRLPDHPSGVIPLHKTVVRSIVLPKGDK